MNESLADLAAQINNLTYTYPNDTKALIDINLEINQGEFYAIMGANGSGKTTTCLFLNGVIPHITGGRVKGSVNVCGIDTFDHPVYEIAQYVGMVLQDPEAQLFSSNVRSEVAFAAENWGIPYQQMVEQVNWALETVRLLGFEGRTPAQLSGGQKQRLSIASGLVVRPKILVLDEPTSQLDPLGTDEVFSVLRELNQDMGLTIVLATHKAEQVAEYADHVVVLDQGRIVAQGDPGAVFSQVELLEKISVPVPQVTQAYWILDGEKKFAQLPVTLEKCQSDLEALLENNRLSINASELISRKNIMNKVVPSHLQPTIEARSVSYVYPGTDELALDHINLKIYPGEFVGVIGQNGAGKSTFVKSILGLLEPSEGDILLDGESISERTPAKVAQKVGLVLQNPDTQLFALSAWEEVAFGPKNCGLKGDELDARVERALKAVGLYEKRDEYPFNFCFGDRRKLSVAAVASMQPEIMIFDEPTTGQDYRGRFELANIARDLNQNGTTMIMITHDMGLIAEFTDRLVVMGKGKILLDGPTREVFLATEVLSETFITPPQITQLAMALGSFGVPPNILTVEEFCRVFTPVDMKTEGAL